MIIHLWNLLAKLYVQDWVLYKIFWTNWTSATRIKLYDLVSQDDG